MGSPSNYEFATRLISWQKSHGRHDLPWQASRDPYRVWLSEIMLQQTQVATVIPYYRRFLERFPSVEALAGAPQEAVLECWAGLGYYARARNLHRCAQAIVSEYGGVFPATQEALQTLPGVGRSTAAAIAVFAFGGRAAILDGNVKRVLSRVFCIEGDSSPARLERQLWSLAESLLPVTDLVSYTQGLMDLGATLCVRGTPLCAACPLSASCQAFASGRQAELPMPRPRKPKRERTSCFLLLSDGSGILLERRSAPGIWGGLWCLPENEWHTAQAFAARHGCELIETAELPTVWHSFTHFRLELRVLHCHVRRICPSASSPDWVWLPRSDIARAALPTPIRLILSESFD